MYPRIGDPDEEEFRLDPRVILAAKAMDRVPDRMDLSPALTPARFIEAAEQAPPPRRSFLGAKLPVPLLVASVVVVVLLGVTLSFAVRPNGELDRPAVSGSATAPVSLYRGDGTSVPAALELRSLAAAAERLVEPASRPVTYTRLQTWSLEMTSAPPAPVIKDEELWWTRDHAGLSVETPLRQWYPVAEVLAGSAESIAAPQTIAYKPGELAVVIDEPATEPAQLAAQFDAHEPGVHGPQAFLRTVRDVYRYHALDGVERGAALRVLAETPGIVYRGTVALEPGRPGAVFTADSEEGMVRDLAVFGPTDGRLMAYQQLSLRRPGLADAVDPYVFFMMSVLASGTTDDVGVRPTATS